jgi:hypothetical protein
MPETGETSRNIDALTQSVADLKRQVAAIARSKTLKGEVLDDLAEGNGSLGQVYLVVGTSMTQEEISTAYATRWGVPISKGGLSGKLSELGRMDLVQPADKRVGGKMLYSNTDYAQGLNLSKALEARLRAGRRSPR